MQQLTECQYGSVLEKYESDYSWWEIVENARKLSTAVAMVLLALYGGAIQAWFIFGINIPYWLMVNKKRPYKPLHEGEKEREEEEDRLLFAARLKYHSISSAKEYASESASSDHDDDQVRPAAGVSGDYPDDDCDHSNQNEARCFYLIESSEVQYKRGEDYEEGKNGKEHNLKLSFKWYEKAAEEGHAIAMSSKRCKLKAQLKLVDMYFHKWIKSKPEHTMVQSARRTKAKAKTLKAAKDAKVAAKKAAESADAAANDEEAAISEEKVSEEAELTAVAAEEKAKAAAEVLTAARLKAEKAQEELDADEVEKPVLAAKAEAETKRQDASVAADRAQAAREAASKSRAIAEQRGLAFGFGRNYDDNYLTLFEVVLENLFISIELLYHYNVLDDQSATAAY